MVTANSSRVGVDATASTSAQTERFRPADAGAGPASAVALDFVGGTLSQIDGLLEHLGVSPGQAGLPGSLFQWTRSSVDGVRIVEVWQAKGQFDRLFGEVILPAVEQLGLPKPIVTYYDVHHYLTQGPDVTDREPESTRAGTGETGSTANTEELPPFTD